MADCSICLDLLRNPVSIPCGHVHCERCLRGHISSGADALKSTCPTCRKPFNIATPDFAFVPRKYHDFILPSVRKTYMDIPSLTAMSKEIDALKKDLESCATENEQLRQRISDLKCRHEDTESKMRASAEKAREARQEVTDLRRKYDSLKHKYWEALETVSSDTASNMELSRNLSRRSSQNFDISRQLAPKAEEHPVSLHNLNTNPMARPKRALPKSRLSNSTRRNDEALLVKRQRTHRHSDVGSSSQLMGIVFKDEDDEDE